MTSSTTVAFNSLSVPGNRLGAFPPLLQAVVQEGEELLVVPRAQAVVLVMASATAPQATGYQILQHPRCIIS